MYTVVDSRQGDSFIAHLLMPPQAGQPIAIGIVRPGGGVAWEGFGVFPWEMQDEAVRWFNELKTDVDLENLMREWGDPAGEETRQLISFIHQTAIPSTLGEHVPEQEPDEDLPDLILPADLVRSKRKATTPRKPRKGKEEGKLSLPYAPRAFPRPNEAEIDDVVLLPLHEYDYIIVSFSGGKDSVACVLYLLELGVPPSRIELWHQAVDGRPHHAQRLWDWPCTEGYCEAFAKAFNMRLLYQWKEKGFLGELLRRNEPTAPTTFQLLNGREMTVGGAGAPGTRLTFPAMEADLMKRWCSAYLKIDVAKKVFTNDPRFDRKRTLIVTGERRQESGNRAKYSVATDYGSTKTRIVHQWRAVLPWFEQDVWEIMERYRVLPHPAYYLGWSRVSCLPCIFGNTDQWATVREVTPKVFNRLAKLEDKFYVAAQQFPGHSRSRENQERRHLESEAKKRQNPGYEPEEFKLKTYEGYLRAGESLRDAAERGSSYFTPDMMPWLQLAMTESFPPELLLVPPDQTWTLPIGAGRHSGGPT